MRTANKKNVLLPISAPFVFINNYSTHKKYTLQNTTHTPYLQMYKCSNQYHVHLNRIGLNGTGTDYVVVGQQR